MDKIKEHEEFYTRATVCLDNGDEQSALLYFSKSYVLLADIASHYKKTDERRSTVYYHAARVAFMAKHYKKARNYIEESLKCKQVPYWVRKEISYLSDDLDVADPKPIQMFLL